MQYDLQIVFEVNFDRFQGNMYNWYFFYFSYIWTKISLGH